jgi:hypothetical protein
LNSAIAHGFDHATLEQYIADYHALKADPELAPYFNAEQRVYDAAKAQVDANCANIEAVSSKQAFGYLPPNSFYYVRGRQDGRRYQVPLGDRLEYLIYGPYESIETGRYEVEFHLSVSPSKGHHTERIQLDVTAHRTRVLAKKTIRGSPTAARSKLVFSNRDSRDALEYRVSGGGRGGTLEFDGVTVRPARRPFAVFLGFLLRLASHGSRRAVATSVGSSAPSEN